MSVTAEEVKAYRDVHFTGLQDARRILERRDRAERMDAMEVELRSTPIGIPKSVVRDLIAIVRELNN